MDQIRKIQPVIISFIVLILAAALGYASGLANVQIVSTGIWQLDPSYQAIYVQAVADAYAQDGNAELATERLSYFCQADDSLTVALDAAAEQYGSIDLGKQENLDGLRTLVDGGQVEQNPNVEVCNKNVVGPFASFRFIGPVLLLLMGMIIAAAGVLVVIRSGDEEAKKTPQSARSKVAESVVAGDERGRATKPTGVVVEEIVSDTSKSAAARGAKISATLEKTDFTTIGEKPPIIQFMTTYLHGDDLYDDAFGIDTSATGFLGETGVGIADTLSVGGTKSVTAFEVWLFDKNDIRTITKVLMSEHAFNDEGIRAKLAQKGDAVQAKPGDKIILETATLKVQARIVDMSFASGGGAPPNAFFDRITLELAAWKQEGAS